MLFSLSLLPRSVPVLAKEVCSDSYSLPLICIHIDVLGIVESVKGASDVFSPISGTLLQFNEELLKKPSLINRETYTKGIEKIVSKI
jgi:hypothetical protein